MTTKVYGDRLPPGTVGPRQVPSLPAAKTSQPPIQVRRWLRNNKHPNAEYESLKNEALNQAGLFRTKDYFSCPGFVGSPTDLAAVDEDRWRFAFRSGPLAHAAFCRVVMASPHVTYRANNTYGLLNLYTSATEAAVVLSATFNYGPSVNVTSSPLGWQYVRVFDAIIDGVTPNTDYYALFRNMSGGHLMGACVYELASMTENFAGYLPQNIGAQGSILDVYREKQRQLIRDLWEKGAPKVFNWTVDPGQYSSGTTGFPHKYKVTASATLTNILDLTSTAVSVNTPGWHPDMRSKNTLRQTSGVPCVMKAFGSVAAGTGGIVALKDSSGTIVAQLNNVFTTTPGWQSVAFNLPATYAKYDVQYSIVGGGSAFSLWAVSIYELD